MAYIVPMHVKPKFTYLLTLKKINDFLSSLRHRPWGILVGVSVSYSTRAVAQLLGESKAYGAEQ